MPEAAVEEPAADGAAEPTLAMEVGVIATVEVESAREDVALAVMAASSADVTVALTKRDDEAKEDEACPLVSPAVRRLGSLNGCSQSELSWQPNTIGGMATHVEPPRLAMYWAAIVLF